MRRLETVCIIIALISFLVGIGAADSTGDTDINAKILEVIALTAPAGIASDEWSLDPSMDNSHAGGNIHVSANVPWKIQVKANRPTDLPSDAPDDTMYTMDTATTPAYHWLNGGKLRMDMPDAEISEFAPSSTNTVLIQDDSGVDDGADVTYKQQGSFSDDVYDPVGLASTPTTYTQLAYYMQWTFTLSRKF